MTDSQSKILAKAVGRRKSAVAQVQIITGTGQFQINNQPAQIYLQNHCSSILSIKAPFEALQNTLSDLLLEGELPNFDTLVKVEGGGLLGQAQAIKLGVARALLEIEEYASAIPNASVENISLKIRKSFKVRGYLTSDSRTKERRKYGLKKARKASQYHKR